MLVLLIGCQEPATEFQSTIQQARTIQETYWQCWQQEDALTGAKSDVCELGFLIRKDSSLMSYWNAGWEGWFQIPFRWQDSVFYFVIWPSYLKFKFLNLSVSGDSMEFKHIPTNTIYKMKSI